MRHHLAIIALAAASMSAAVVAGPAFASDDDEVIATAQAKPSAQALTATAPPAPAPAAPVKQLTTQEQIAAFITANPGPAIDDGPRGVLPADLSDDRDENGKRKVHGSMGVSVGTGGYRSVYATGLFPVGENTTVGVAVSKTDFGKHGGGWYDPSYGGGYGGGYAGGYGGGYGYGPGYGRARGGDSQSVALSIMTGNSRGGGGPPDGCAPGFRDGGRYVEPLWVEGMRDGNHPCAAAGPRADGSR
jgi:hypothetical protein